MNAVAKGPDGRPRCAWCLSDPVYVRYHDEEWGRPVRDDVALFEKLCLEGFQAGLSWLTILRKREAFRRAFDGFDFRRLARRRSVARLLRDPGIVRHRGKIESVFNNARRACELVEEHGSLAAYFAAGGDAKALSRDLKRRGWSFVGPTTVHSFLQAAGFVNEHARGCFLHGYGTGRESRSAGGGPYRRRPKGS